MQNKTIDKIGITCYKPLPNLNIDPGTIFIADFETTVKKGQTSTDVWAAALIDLMAEDDPSNVEIYGYLSQFVWRLTELAKNNDITVYFHNLKFDGTFIINYLLTSKFWKEDTVKNYNEKGQYNGQMFIKKIPKKMKNGHFRYSISDKGMWYTVTLKVHGHLIEIRDSLKLLPFSVKQLGKGFDLKHKKLEMEYEGERYPGCNITDEEKAYIANDVLVVKEALSFMYEQGHDKLTIGGCCLEEFKSYYTKDEWEANFPNLYEEHYGKSFFNGSIGNWIRKSYKGGWCYVVPEKAGKEFRKHGITCDVNSLYPSMMHSDSGNKYPVGYPTYFEHEIPAEALADDKYYFVHVKTRFYIKENMLPTIMIKYSEWYPTREWLVSSDAVDMRLPKKERYKLENRVRYVIDSENKIQPARPDLYLTMTDWELLQKHYNLEDTEIIDGFYFNAKIGIFDNYINKYAAIKQANKGAKRQLAKLFLNNLYGKFATSIDSSYKIAYLNDKGELRTYTVHGYDKIPGYIPIGSAITSYARAFTITAAQANYYGPNKPGFIYADTDSIHCDLEADQIKGAPKHPTKFNHWKYEASWDFAKFIRAKTYVEHVYAEDEEPIENPYYNLKCAGMSDHVKNLFLYSVEQNVSRETYKTLDEDEKKFVSEKRTFKDFNIGLCIPGMLKSHNIKGGTLLVKSWFKMRDVVDA